MRQDEAPNVSGLRWTSPVAGHRHLVGFPYAYVSRQNDTDWYGVVEGRSVQGGRLFPTGTAAQRAVEAHIAVTAHLNRRMANLAARRVGA